jgi:hypothetical protein
MAYSWKKVLKVSIHCLKYLGGQTYGHDDVKLYFVAKQETSVFW